MRHKWIVAGILLFILSLVLFSSCYGGERVPSGIYSCIAADTGEMYTFSGRSVRVTLFVMGNIVEDHSGTYRLKDGTITMEFPTDSYGTYSGSYSYSISEDGLTMSIGDSTFKKEAIKG